ncbi:MAG TPA: DUF2076 domain-containing protein [Pseudorhodoplanes sp.]|nr:DUF2076 domain-containing protein [Pseudorhodoplanes sp.]
MTPQERQLVEDLFDRLATLERNKRDPQAEALIGEGARRAPNALYALVQTVLVQDEALRSADDRIRELEGGGAGAPGQGGFLDNMRETFMGRRGSVPSVGGRDTPWQGRAPEQPAPPASAGGGSFLGTAAASAAGVIGGALLLNSFRGMFGGGNQQGMLDQGGGQNTPWGGGNAANSDLAREAGVNEIGRGGGRDTSNDRAGLFDSAKSESDDDDSGAYDSDGDFDIGGDSDDA